MEQKDEPLYIQVDAATESPVSLERTEQRHTPMNALNIAHTAPQPSPPP